MTITFFKWFGILMIVIVPLCIAYIEFFPLQIPIPKEVKNAVITPQCKEKFGIDSWIVTHIKNMNRPFISTSEFYDEWSEIRPTIIKILEDSSCPAASAAAVMLENNLKLMMFEKTEKNTTHISFIIKDPHRYRGIYKIDRLFFLLWNEGKYRLVLTLISNPALPIKVPSVPSGLPAQSGALHHVFPPIKLNF
jgi:hypothetical protein